MSGRPHPTPYRPLHLPQLVPEHRVLDCAHYADCLDTAAARDWHGWTCRECPHAEGRLAPYSGHPPLRLCDAQSSRARLVERVTGLLRERGPMRVRDIAAAVGLAQPLAQRLMLELHEEGTVVRVGVGIYELVDGWEGAA